ncbi:hypothetical protein [Coleofasciculus sp.]|uniref:hypothetical protein n=1 Tax=Coleofasciculus sp. TaxID=3100458 RepID=UPI0039F8A530
MATKTAKVYIVLNGTDGKEVAIYGVRDIYDGLKGALGCQVLADGQSPPNGAFKAKNISQALSNGVARILVSYNKSGREQRGKVLCSATNADTVLSAIVALKYRNSSINSARFLG